MLLKLKTFFLFIIVFKCIIYNKAVFLVYSQNPPAFKIARSKSTRFFYIYFFISHLFYIFFAFFKLTFHNFFTITNTPNPYPRSVSGSQIWSDGFWSRVDFKRVPFFIKFTYFCTYRKLVSSLMCNKIFYLAVNSTYHIGITLGFVALLDKHSLFFASFWT